LEELLVIVDEALHRTASMQVDPSIKVVEGGRE
jgi:hypothetical protein